MDSTDFYRSFHTHPVNKLIHVFCIPMIVLSTMNFLSKVSYRIQLPPYKYGPDTRHVMHNTITIDYNTIFAFYSIYYYLFWNFKIGFVMQMYISFLSILSKSWRESDKKWFRHSIIMFVSAWMMQFLGHAIEGNRPALLTSLTQSVFQAPLFTLEYIYPGQLLA